MSEVKHSAAFQRKIDRWRMMGWGFVGLSGVAVVGMALLISLDGGFYVEGAVWHMVGMVGSMFLVVFGPVMGWYMLVLIRQQIAFYDAVMSGRSPVLARWQCTSEEATAFIAMEAARLKVSNRMDFFMALFVAVGTLIVIRLKHSIDNWTPVAVAGPIAILSYVVWRISDGMQFRGAKRRVQSEIVMAEEGILAGPDVFTWRSPNCGLAGAKYEKNNPDVLVLTFRAGTTVSAQTGPKDFDVRVPVTAGKAEVVRGVIATSLVKHLMR